MCSFFFFSFIFLFYIVFCQVYPKDPAALQPYECNSSYKMCKHSQKDTLTALRAPSSRNSDTPKSMCSFFVLLFIAWNSWLPCLYWLTVEAAQGHHARSQWQQWGVIITIWVKDSPIFHAGVRAVRKSGHRGFVNKINKSVCIWKAVVWGYADVPHSATTRL